MDRLHERIAAAQNAIARYRNCPPGDLVGRENELNEVGRAITAFYEEAKKTPGFLERVLARVDRALAKQ